MKQFNMLYKRIFKELPLILKVKLWNELLLNIIIALLKIELYQSANIYYILLVYIFINCIIITIFLVHYSIETLNLLFIWKTLNLVISLFLSFYSIYLYSIDYDNLIYLLESIICLFHILTDNILLVVTAFIFITASNYNECVEITFVNNASDNDLPPPYESLQFNSSTNANSINVDVNDSNYI